MTTDIPHRFGLVVAMRWLLGLLLLGLVHFAATAGPLRFQISGLSALGPNVGVALNFIDGGAPASQVDVFGFSSDGGLAIRSVQGDVAGSLGGGFRLQDGAFFNELLLGFTSGDSLSFLFETTAAAAAGGFADAFSVFLVDLNSGLTVLDTTDASGANALFLQSVDGSNDGELQVFQSAALPGVQWSVQPAGTPVPMPEPPVLALVLLSLLGLAATHRRAAWLPRWLGCLALLLGGAAATAPVAAQDITASVQITRAGFVLNRSTYTFDTQVTLTNRAAAPLSGPLRLVIDSLQRANVVLYNPYGSTEAGKSFVAVPLPMGMLAPGASATALVKFINSGQQVTQVGFKVEGLLMSPGQSAQIVVQALAPNAQGGPGSALGAGYDVRVDGELRGRTDASGRLSLLVPASAQVVAVSKPPNEGGTAIVQGLVPGQPRDVSVVVDEGKEIFGPGRLRFDQVQQGLLSRAASRINLRFHDFERPVRLASLDNVVLLDSQRRIVNLEGVVTLASDGSLVASPAALYAAIGNRSGRLEIELDGADASGLVHRGAVAFYLADFRVRVQLQAPPSNPALPVAGVVVNGSLLNTDVRFVAQADGAGYVTLPDLPRGNLALNASSTAGGITYTGGGTAALTRDSLVRLTLRAAQDVLAGVPAISVQALPPGAPRPAASLGLDPALAPTAAERTDRAYRHALQAARGAPAAALPANSPTRVSISVTGGAQNQRVERSAQLVVPQGVKKVLLSYSVFTAEYPTYVLAQSI